MGTKEVDIFTERLLKWAKNERGINAIALVGSHVLGTAREDSDIDLIVIAKDANEFLIDTKWISALGQVSMIKRENWGLLQALRTFYTDSLEVEFGICGTDWARVDPVDEGTKRVVSDGMKILYDPLGILFKLEQSVRSLPRS